VIELRRRRRPDRLQLELLLSAASLALLLMTPFRRDGDRADGLLIVSTLPPAPELGRLLAASMPCVLVDAKHPELPSVVVDDVAGGEMATRHLIELGHRRIGFVGDTPPEFHFDWSRDRTRGYERALQAAGLELRPEYAREGTQSLHVARAIASELLSLRQRPTAIFAASDTPGPRVARSRARSGSPCLMSSRSSASTTSTSPRTSG
jgi:hypothetical protein